MNDEINIIPLDIEHIDEVHEIELECFTIPWPKEAFIKELTQNEHAIYLAAFSGEIIAGYAGMWHIINEGHITNVAVSPTFRNNGIGDMLVKALIEKAREMEMIGITLEVRISNYTAQRLYSRNGFKPEGFRKNYYSDTHEDAIIMWKHLFIG